MVDVGGNGLKNRRAHRSRETVSAPKGNHGIQPLSFYSGIQIKGTSALIGGQVAAVAGCDQVIFGKQSFNSSLSFPGIIYTGGQIYLCNGFQRCSVYLSPPMPAQHLNGTRQGMSFFFQQVRPGVYSAQDFFLLPGRDWKSVV